MADFADFGNLLTDTESENDEFSENDGEETEVLEILFGEVDFKSVKKLGELGKRKCVCMKCETEDEHLNLLAEMSDWTPHVNQMYCMFDNIIRAHNFLKTKEDIDYSTIAFADLFFRSRHEILSKLTLMSLSLPVQETDIKFSKFGINSERTPDYIIKIDNCLLIIEVSASSNYEKAAVSKGVENLGFESKYSKELKMLDDLCSNYIYLPIIFDMSNPYSNQYLDEIDKIKDMIHINNSFLKLLDSYRKEFCFLSINMKSLISPSAAILFNQDLIIKNEHEDLEFLFTPEKFDQPYTYEEINIMPNIYTRMNNLWFRIPMIMDKFCLNSEDKLSLYMDVKDYKLNFKLENNAPSFLEYQENYDKGNKIFFFKNLKIIIGNVIKYCYESEQGVKFLELVASKEKNRMKSSNDKIYEDILPTNQNHVTTEYSIEGMLFKKNEYSLKSKQYNMYNYCPKFFDKDYENKILKGYEQIDRSFSPNLDPEEYNIDLNLDLLAENLVEKINIDSMMDDLKIKLIKENTFNSELPLRKPKLSMPFTLPLANFSSKDYCRLEFKDTDFISELYEKINKSDPFTSIILSRILDDDYKMYDKPKLPSDRLKNMYDTKIELARNITKLYKDEIKGLSMLEIRSKKIDNEVYLSDKKKISDLSKKIIILEKEEKVKKNVSFVRLPSKNRKTVIGSKFDIEMSHFNKKEMQSIYSGVGIRENIDSDFNSLKSVFENIVDDLVEYKGKNPDIIIDTNVQTESNLLYELKQKSIQDYYKLIEDIKNSSLGHACSFVSRLAHSLMYYSQMPFNSDYIRVDNLGYKDVILFVRGGKKIFKSKSSKLFRLIYPIHDSLIDWYSGDGLRSSSSKIINIEGVNYILTPWQLMHESVLNDSISFYTRVVSFTVLNLDPKLDFKTQYSKIAINTLLSFHNRRKTEVFLSNMRYILLSTMGEYTGIQNIFSEFIGFNYDYFQSYLRYCIILNYPAYFKSFLSISKNSSKNPINSIKNMKLKNIFSGSSISNENDLALMVYSTFLMTKAPYQKYVERASNLIGILKIHDQYSSEVGLNLTPEEQFEKLNIMFDPEVDHFKDYVYKLFKCDFNFDAKYCSNLGIFCNSIFENKNLTGKIHTEWLSIMNRPWDKMATSTGLRGDPNDIEDFWGQKGYFVVYKKVFENENFCDDIDRMLNDDSLTDDEKRKILRKTNTTQIDNIRGKSDKELIFHVVDKIQWRGSREIYVMDINTKSMQQPIEQFMSFLCKNLDNELISIPSDRRAQTIHHSIFEKDLPLKDLKMYYLTLDCSKWAPKSIFVKFCNMILSMRCIPSSFKTHFLNYISKLYRKRVYFNKGECNVILNNKNLPEIYSKFLIEDADLKGYFIKMPYSWVMGIFNYTSSFMHSVNQLYAGYLINKSALLNFKEDTSLVMFAHSDDSGGRMSARHKQLITRNLMLYEINLKCCNHILSKKKSVVSKVYFEILSVIYLFKKLLALLPKFLGGLRFLPTDKGISQDMMQSYSKCIEVIIAGASFDIAYLVMKMYSMLVWRFYMNRDPLQSDYDRPVQYLGIPDSHPISVLISGSSSDIIRILKNKGEDYLAKLMTFSNKLIDCVDDSGPIRPYKFKIQIRNIENKFNNHTERFDKNLNNWTIKNVNLNTTPFNALNFLSKLKDPGFMGSMVNESLTRRMSRAYFFRNSETLITKTVNINFKKLIDTIDTFMLLTEFNELSTYLLDNIYLNKDEFMDDFETSMTSSRVQIKVIKNVLSSPLKLLKYMDSISINNKDIINVSRTIKPSHLQIIKTGKAFSVNFDPAELVSYIKDVNLRWCLPGYKKLLTAEKELNQLCKSLEINLDEIDENTLLLLCRNYTSKDVKDIYLYSQIPSDLRVIKTYTGILSFLSTNSIKDCEINGLVLNLGKNLTDPTYVTTQISNEIYYINTVLNLLVILSKKMNKDRLFSLTLNPIEIVEWEGGTVSDFLKWVDKLRYSDVSYNLIKLNNDYLKNIKVYEGKKIISAEILRNSSYYTFLKQQVSKDSWRGKGDLLICVNEDHFHFILYNDKVVEVFTNCNGKINMQSTNYILDTLLQNGIKFSRNYLINPNLIKTKKMFGFDHVGDLNNSEPREMNIGVPSYNLKGNIPFINMLEVYDIEFIHENLYLIKSNNPEYRDYKIYSLRPSLASLIEITKNLFNKEDFEIDLITGGLDTVSEFLYNEVLPDFGLEQYLSKNEFFENFISSKTYEILHTIKNIDNDKIPSKILDINIPSPNGSLSRLLANFEEITGEKIINSRKFINPEIMRIRNEYPESFSLILTEKMVDNYKNLFSYNEDQEIQSQYLKASQINDHELLKSKLINLMCYWGYSSLVNMLSSFNYLKDKRNFEALCSIDYQDPRSNFYISTFPKILTGVFKSVSKFNSVSRYLDYPVELLKEDDLEKMFLGYISCLTFGCYGFKSIFYNKSIWRYKFHNTIIALLKDENFCEDLNNNLSNIPVINTLPIDFQNRYRFLSIINCMYLQWLNSNKNDFLLNSNPLLQTLPDGIPRPKKLSEDLVNGIKISPSMVYHHSVVPRGYTNNYDNVNYSFRLDTVKYNIKTILSEFSEIEVPILMYHSIKRPLTEDFIEGEIWEEIKALMDIGDYCVEEVDELLAEEKLKYIAPEVKVKKGKGEFKVVSCLIHFIFNPINEHKNYLKFVRQVGENVVIITNTLIGRFNEIYNSHIRLINNNGVNLVAHICCSKHLNLKFWDEFLGGEVLKLGDEIDNILMPDCLINNKGEIVNSSNLGYEFKEIFKTENIQLDENYKTVGDSEDESGNSESTKNNKINDKEVGGKELDEKEELLNKYLNMLDESLNNNKLSSENYDNIKNKILELNKTELILDSDYYLKQILCDLGIENIKSLMNQNLFSNLGKDEKIKIFQSPTFFGLARYGTNISKNIIRNKGLKAELNSLNENLVNACMNGSITISKKMKKLAKSSFKIWISSIKNNWFLQENKKFFLTLFLLICNDANESEDDDFDDDWQNIINDIQNFIALSDDDSDSEEDNIQLSFTSKPFSKIKYHISGVN